MEEKRISSLAYPANSHASKEKETETKTEQLPKEVKSVVSKSARASKKGPIKRFFSKIFADDFDDIKTNIISDTLLPAIRDMIFDAIMGGLSMSLYGSTYAATNKRRSGTSVINYGKISTSNSYSKDRLRDRRESSAVMEDLVFDSREDALSVLDGIMDLMETYDLVSVADVYSLAGFGTTPTDNKYGWDNPGDLAKMKIVRSGRDWCLKLPRPYPID